MIGPNFDAEADLVLSNITIADQTVSQGSAIEVEYFAINRGSVDAVDSRTAVYLSASEEFDPDNAILIEDQRISNLERGEGDRGRLALDIPADFAIGTYYLFVAIDHTGLVSEGDENNNVSDPYEITIREPEPVFTEEADQTQLPYGGVYRGLSGDDTIIGSDDVDVIYGNDNNDSLYGVQSGDLLSGGLGADFMNGEQGADSIFGSNGHDTLLGGESLTLSTTEAQVYRVYQATLDRAPDAAGLAGWVSQIESGAQSLLQVIAGFTGSQEFQTVYGALSDDAFVELLYNNVLERASDAAGLQGWLDFIDGGGTRAEVVRGFSESAEFITNTDYAGAAWATHVQLGDVEGQVYRLYWATLDRAPDTAGFQGWVEIIEGGSSLLDIIPGFVNSAEFQNVYGSLEDEAFVELLYNNVLNRSSDAGGLQAWLDFIDGGGTRAEVVRGFSESPEFINGSSSALADFMQNVNTDWNDTLIGGADNDILFGGRGADRFVFDAEKYGVDIVYGLEAWDIIEMNGFGYTNADDFAAQLSQDSTDVLFSDQGVSITFTNTDVATVTSLLDISDFASPNQKKVDESDLHNTNVMDTGGLDKKPDAGDGLSNTNTMDGMPPIADITNFQDLISVGREAYVTELIDIYGGRLIVLNDDYFEVL